MEVARSLNLLESKETGLKLLLPSRLSVKTYGSDSYCFGMQGRTFHSHKDKAIATIELTNLVYIPDDLEHRPEGRSRQRAPLCTTSNVS